PPAATKAPTSTTVLAARSTATTSSGQPRSTVDRYPCTPLLASSGTGRRGASGPRSPSCAMVAPRVPPPESCERVRDKYPRAVELQKRYVGRWGIGDPLGSGGQRG